MNNLQKTLLVAGAIGLGSAIAAPAFAGGVQAYASGSATIVLMNGASQSVGGEIAAPPGPAFANGSVVVRPNGVVGAGAPPTDVLAANSINLATNTATISSLNVFPGAATAAPSTSSSVEAAVTAKLPTAAASLTSANLSNADSIIRAWQSGLQ